MSSSKGKGKRTPVMVGGGAGEELAIGAIAGGGKGAAIGALIGAAAGAGGAGLTGNRDITLRAETAARIHTCCSPYTSSKSSRRSSSPAKHSFYG